MTIFHRHGREQKYPPYTLGSVEDRGSEFRGYMLGLHFRDNFRLTPGLHLRVNVGVKIGVTHNLGYKWVKGYDHAYNPVITQVDFRVISGYNPTRRS